ncbi:MAG: ABC transporter ATP-binding protein [Saprospiraceae bacterium]|nr:ABC transporter ATP-binding protein [Saprospiraceae bacterium]
MIRIENVSKSFGKNQVLNGISLDMNEPGVTAILGPNGSGKTTLIKCLMGMVLPDGGEIRFKGDHIRGKHLYRRDIGYLPQIARFPDNLKVKELITWIANVRQQPDQRDKFVEAFGVSGILDQTLGTLSGGTRQKINLILAMMHDSPVLVFDEPTVGLDPVAMVMLKNLIAEEKRNGKIILISTHIMDFVEQVADRIVYLLDGDIYYDGTIPDLKEKYGKSSLEKVIVSILSQSVEEVSEPTNGMATHPKVFI